MLIVKQMKKFRKYRMNKAEHISYNRRWRPKQTVVDLNMTEQMRPHRLALSTDVVNVNEFKLLTKPK